MNNLTAEQLAFRDKQEALIKRIYAAIREHQIAELDKLNAEYDGNMAALTSEQQDTWHASVVDPELYSLYSDAYKDRRGFRDRSFMNHRLLKARYDALQDEPIPEIEDTY